MLQKFVKGKLRLRIFWSIGNLKDSVDDWSFNTLRFHLNKNGKRNMARFNEVGLVDPKTRKIIGRYSPIEFEW